MIRRTLLLLLSALFLSLPLQAEEQQATALRNTELRSEPFSDAKVVTQVKAKSTLTILQRKGGWYQARDSRNRTGWLRMSTIRFGDGTASSNGSGVKQTLDFLTTGRSGASGVTVATGIRGLDSADVANATPDHAAVKRMDSYQVSTTDARSYAATAKLRTKTIKYIKEAD